MRVKEWVKHRNNWQIEMDISLRQISRFENDENLRRYEKFLELVVALDLYKRNEEDK